jgi:hypothetical protein
MEFAKKGLFGTAILVLWALVGLQEGHAQAVDKDSTHWVGEWRDDGNLQYAYNLYLKPLGEGKMSGYFEWKLIWTWLPEHKPKVGSVAKEYVVGVYDAATGKLNLRGVRQTDPADIISMDIYVIQLRPDGKGLDGINVKPENYKGSMFGVLLPPKPPAAATADAKGKPGNAGKNPAATGATAAKNPADSKGTAVNPPAQPKTGGNPSPSGAGASGGNPSVAAGKGSGDSNAKPASDGAVDKELASREIVTKEELKAEETQVRIRIYDESMIDGDVVSLNWNGEWVMRYYRVAKLPKEIVLDLQKGENTLVMHAENLGRYPPNTASIAIQRGTKTQVFVLNSDMGKSEAIRIVRQ